MSRQRQKGTAKETEVAKVLRPVWPDIKRTGSRDYGAGDFDPDTTPGFTVEVKNHKRMALADWVDQSVDTAQRLDDGRIPIVIHNRPRKNVQEDYVTMPLWAFVELMRTTGR